MSGRAGHPDGILVSEQHTISAWRGQFGLLFLPRALACNPTLDRILNLKVQTVTMVYGDKGWMDVLGGLEVKRICTKQNSELKSSVVNKTEYKEEEEERSPDINVHIIRNSGHLIMLENWEEFNSSVIMAGKGEQVVSPKMPQPIILT